MWHEFCENPGAITSLYGEIPRDLAQLELAELSIHRDGPRLTLSFLGLPYPERPPSRWVAQGFNAAGLRLVAFPLTAFELSGWSTSNPVQVTVAGQESGSKSVEIVGPHGRIAFRAGFLRIDAVTGYLRSEA